MDDIARLLWGVVTVLIALVWRELNRRIKGHDEHLHATDQSVFYLREQVHEIRNMLPNPAEIENRRRETRENFDRIFSMLREIERVQNEMIGELRARKS